jgi:hypothetical protein
VFTAAVVVATLWLFGAIAWSARLFGLEHPMLRSPIGLDIGARTPEETAVSIAAEIISLRWGGSGQPLTATEGAIHGTERFGSEAPDA